NGEVPLLDLDPAKPNLRYFQFVDSVIQMAATKGLFMGLLPTWGDKVDQRWGQGPVVFNEKNAASYGKWLGERYKDYPNIIWIIGGDRLCEGNEAVWEALATGIRSADSNHLMTYHPMGSRSSSECFHQSEWLDFNMHQSGHSDRYIPNYRKIMADYALDPPKPCMDAEPIYESHPFGWNPKNGIAGEDEVRRAAYWALFSGAHGHSYGNHCIWQFYSSKVKAVNHPPMYWQKAMDLPGAWDMLHVRRLMESRPMLKRYPDQSIIWGPAGGTTDHIAATQGEGYAFVYLPSNPQVIIDFSRIRGDSFKTWWYNPRTGEATFIKEVEGEVRESFRVPVSGVDWVLVIDNATYIFNEPGKI
ncbi:MAG: glycoside hydrolase family 140 protein, partial [Bacteroidales bacterium]|nr:glycoside hydrolase family 140 protein [Bacteroidales bacterium]